MLKAERKQKAREIMNSLKGIFFQLCLKVIWYFEKVTLTIGPAHRLNCPTDQFILCANLQSSTLWYMLHSRTKRDSKQLFNTILSMLVVI